MPELSTYVLFCDSFRQEIDNKSTIVGTYGGTCAVPSFPSKMHNLFIVGLGRVNGIRSVETTLTIKLLGDNAAKSPSPMSTTLSQDDDDDAVEWQLQAAADLRGMPVDKGVTLVATFTINGQASSTSTLTFVEETRDEDDTISVH